MSARPSLLAAQLRIAFAIDLEQPPAIVPLREAPPAAEPTKVGVDVSVTPVADHTAAGWRRAVIIEQLARHDLIYADR